MYEKESTLTNDCCDLLNKMPMVCAIITPNKGGKKSSGRRGKAKRLGIADIHACINGRFVAIENKLDGKKQSPGQIEYEEDVKKSGGLYWVIESSADLIKKITKLRGQELIINIYNSIGTEDWDKLTE